MKKVTAIVPDDADLSALINVAVSLTLEKMNSDMEDGPPKRTNHRNPGMTTATAIMSHYTPEGKFMKSLVEIWLTEKGYNAGSTSPAISKLVKEGYVRSLGGQRYIFVKPLENIQ